MKTDQIIQQIAAELLAALPKARREQLVNAAVAGLVNAPRAAGKKSAAAGAAPIAAVVEDALRVVVQRIVVDILTEDAETMDLLRERVREVVGKAIEDGASDTMFRRISSGALATLRR